MVRILYSELHTNKPIKIVIDNLKKSEIYAGKYILLHAFIEFDKYTRSVEISVPYYEFIATVRSLPTKVQKMFNEGKVSCVMTKQERGNMKLDNVQRWKSHS